MSNILETLEKGPENIRIASLKVENAENALKHAKDDLGTAEAIATLKYSDAKNQKLLEANVKLDEDVKTARLKLFEAEATFRTAKIGLDQEENRFVSARKIAGLDEKVLHSISSSNIA